MLQISRFSVVRALVVPKTTHTLPARCVWCGDPPEYSGGGTRHTECFQASGWLSLEMQSGHAGQASPARLQVSPSVSKGQKVRAADQNHTVCFKGIVFSAMN